MRLFRTNLSLVTIKKKTCRLFSDVIFSSKYPLHEAAKIGDVQSLKKALSYLLATGGETHINEHMSLKVEKRTPIETAEDAGHLEAARYLIDFPNNLSNTNQVKPQKSTRCPLIRFTHNTPT